MNPILAFVVVMLVWTVSDLVAKKTQSLLSSLFVASIIFFVGFLPRGARCALLRDLRGAPRRRHAHSGLTAGVSPSVSVGACEP